MVCYAVSFTEQASKLGGFIFCREVSELTTKRIQTHTYSLTKTDEAEKLMLKTRKHLFGCCYINTRLLFDSYYINIASDFVCYECLNERFKKNSSNQ